MNGYGKLNRYLLDIDSNSDCSYKEKGEGEMSSKTLRPNKGGNVRRKFKKHVDLFFVEGGMCSYDNETNGDNEVPLRYMHYVMKW